MSDENTQIMIGSGDAMEMIEMATLLNASFDDVEEYRFENRPAGLYELRIKEAGLGTQETKNGVRAVIFFNTEVINCESLVDKAVNPESQIGEFHRESFFITDPVKDFGRVKAFVADACLAVTPGQAIPDQLLELSDQTMRSEIKHRKDKTDPTIVYASINGQTLKALNKAQEAVAA